MLSSKETAAPRPPQPFAGRHQGWEASIPFFGSLKTELVHRIRFRTRREARAALFEYIKIFLLTNDGATRASATGRRHRPGGT